MTTQMENKRFEVRDFRNKQFYMVDDEYLNGYAKLCGWKSTLVYMSLCRHASKNQESFPSINRMAKELGVSRDTIIDGIKALLEWRLIKVKETSGKNNVYILIDKNLWKSKPNQSPVATSVPQQLVADNNLTSRPQQLVPVADSDSKDIHIKDTHIRIGLSRLKKEEILNRIKNRERVM